MTGPHAPIAAPEGQDVALVFTDIQGSTRLWERSREAMGLALELHNQLLREELARTGGYEVKTEGDSFMVAFRSALEAVRWCLHVQEALLRVEWPAALLQEDLAKEERGEGGTVLRRGLRVRMGVHAGKPDSRPDPTTGRMDYFGPDVNRAARVSNAADGGQVLVTEAVWRMLKDRTEEIGRPVVVDVGVHRFRDLESPERVFQILPAGLAARRFAPLRGTARRTALVAGVVVASLAVGAGGWYWGRHVRDSVSPILPPVAQRAGALAAGSDVGWLFFDPFPWAECTIDGTPVGPSPLVGHALTPGRHTLEFRGIDGRQGTLEFNIRAARPTLLR